MTTPVLVVPAVDAPFPIFVYVNILCDELRFCVGVGYENDMTCSDTVSILVSMAIFVFLLLRSLTQ